MTVHSPYGGSYEPPRWRNRRMRDVRDITIAYSFAIAFTVDLFAGAVLSITAGQSLADSAIIVTFVLVLYFGAGALLIALAARRIVTWPGNQIALLEPVRWYSFLIWPLLIGALLVRVARPSWA